MSIATAEGMNGEGRASGTWQNSLCDAVYYLLYGPSLVSVVKIFQGRKGRWR